jgi:rRNA maturation protein Rpf1
LIVTSRGPIRRVVQLINLISVFFNTVL